jgi:hypothetical protein
MVACICNPRYVEDIGRRLIIEGQPKAKLRTYLKNN